ncbi:MAG: cell division protein FtsQ/DivIB [Vulcanimicrobiaceae bacterium]
MNKPRPRAKPARRKKSAASRLRPFWILIVLLLVVAGAGGYYAASWPGFYPRHVRVVGNTVVSSSEILSRAAIAQSQNVWLQNAGAAAGRIEAIPYIATARVHRMLPADVTIDVTERKPYAVVRSGEERALVDRSLRVLSTGEVQGALPIFALRNRAQLQPGAFLKDSVLQHLRDDYDALLAGHVIVTRLAYDRFDDLDAATHDGVSILFGDDTDLEKKIPLVDPILSQVARRGRAIRAIDLRAPATPVVVYRTR